MSNHRQGSAGEIVTKGVLEPYPLYVQSPKKRSDFFAIRNAQLATLAWDSTVINYAPLHQDGPIKVFSADYQSMVEVRDIPGNLEMVSMITAWSADAKLPMERETVKKLVSYTILNASQDIILLVAVSAVQALQTATPLDTTKELTFHAPKKLLMVTQRTWIAPLNNNKMLVFATLHARPVLRELVRFVGDNLPLAGWIVVWERRKTHRHVVLHFLILIHRMQILQLWIPKIWWNWPQKSRPLLALQEEYLTLPQPISTLSAPKLSDHQSIIQY